MLEGTCSCRGRAKASSRPRNCSKRVWDEAAGPVHQYREDHHRPPPGQARRPSADPDRPGESGLPHRRTSNAPPHSGCIALAAAALPHRLGCASPSCTSSAFPLGGAAVLALTDLSSSWQSARPATHLSHGSPLAGSGISRSQLASSYRAGDERGYQRRELSGRLRQAGTAYRLGHRANWGSLRRQAAAIGWLLASSRAAAPAEHGITSAARRISASSLHERLALHGPDDERAELADTLDGLFARLEAYLRRLSGDSPPTPRTSCGPQLTRERTLLQVTLADPAATTGTWQAVSQELLASPMLKQEHLHRGPAHPGQQRGSTSDERELADLAAIAWHAAVAAARPAIGRLGLHVQAHGFQPATLDGDLLLVQQLAANLIDNAVRHKRFPGGAIQVSTSTSPAGCRPVGDQLRPGSPGCRSRPPVPALPAPRPPPRPPRRRPRTRPVHRPCHRHRPRRHYHRPAPARRRPDHRGHLPRPPARPPGVRPATAPSRPHEAAGRTWPQVPGAMAPHSNSARTARSRTGRRSVNFPGRARRRALSRPDPWWAPPAARRVC